MVSDGLPGGFKMYTLGRGLSAKGFQKVGTTISGTYGQIADEMLSVKVEVKGLLRDIYQQYQQINSGRIPILIPPEIQKAIDLGQAIDGWLTPMQLLLRTDTNDCQRWKVMERLGNKLIDKFWPTF